MALSYVNHCDLYWTGLKETKTLLRKSESGGAVMAYCLRMGGFEHNYKASITPFASCERKLDNVQLWEYELDRVIG